MKKPPIKVRIAVVLTLVTIITVWYFVSHHEDNSKIMASGTIEVKEVDLAAAINARVVKLYKDEGDSVKAGDVVAKLDVKVVESGFEAAETAYKNADRNYKRSKNLFESNSISQQQYEMSQTAFFGTKAEYEKALYMLNESKVKAPWDGVLLEKHVEEGELISAGTPLFTLGDLSTVTVSIYVPLPELGKIKLNGEARIKIDSFKDKEYIGRIKSISSEAEFTPKNVQTKDERVKQVFEIKIGVDNPSGELKPGMPCDVVIVTEIVKIK